MKGFTRVNLHCHSVFSDGMLTPQALAERLAAAGVGYAALADHNTIDSQAEFQAALRKRHIGYISGVELAAQYGGKEAHLLGYGFSTHHPELIATLHSLRQARDVGVDSIAVSLRKSGDGSNLENGAAQSSAPDGRLDIQQAIDLIHRAGGRIFLAHPFTLATRPEALSELLAQLKSWGLDGIEVYYAPYSEEQRNLLESMARQHGLLMCGGTDVHFATDPFDVSMPTQAWKQFRDAVAWRDPSFHQPGETSSDPPGQLGSGAGVERPRIYRRRYFVLRILLPTVIAISLFVVIIWGMILPTFENSLLDRKREMIRELTNTAYSILASYERDERAGKYSRQEAQALAIAQIENLRYGREGKDYFWLQDMQPRIIMHPYRPDLNGQDVSGFTDPRGVHIFIEFSELVRRKGEGYIEYVFQWKDDPQRLEAKESYVKGFEPWGWVIGTGIYIEDVQQEIARIERNLVIGLLVISVVVILLLAFVVQQSLRIEQQRRDIEQSLHDSTERYRSLVEATTEGTLLVLDGRCRYANPILMRLLGVTMAQLELLDLADILPRDESNAAVWEYIDRTEDTRELGSFDGVLQRMDGSVVECVLALNPISSGGLSGFILLARPVAAPSGAEGSGEPLASLAQESPVGLFRAKAARRGVFVELNAAARAMLAHTSVVEADQPALADLFADAAEFDALMDRLQKQGAVDGHVLHLETVEAGTITLLLDARLSRDGKGQPAWIEGTFIDITDAQKDAAVKDALVEKLQSSLLFLHEPVSSISRQTVTCGLETPARKAAALMTAQDASAILVQSESGTIIGMVTDHDLRSRVLAANVDLNIPVRRIMSAPLVTVGEETPIFEALLRMEEHGVQYLAVEDQYGKVVGVVRSKELVQFHRYGSIILTREIGRASSAAEVAQFRDRTPALVRALLESGGKPRNITRMLSTLCDATTEKLIDLAVAELGPPPVEFAFLAMGSQGRQEQTLLTDQDNAILYAVPGSAAQQAAAEEYFSRLGARVCEGLAEAGYPLCRGQVMATNPRWRADLAQWQSNFSAWIFKAEPQELLEFSIFFDFRPVYGNADLAHRLRSFIHGVLDENPSFFPHMAQNSLLFKPPTRLPGKIYLSGGEHPGTINLKDAMMPVVNFARLYALQRHVAQTNTLGRLDALVEKQALSSTSRDDIATAYEFLMKLRIQRQLAASHLGSPMDNLIQPTALSQLEETLLQQAFVQISAVQKKISYDFLGGVG